MTLNETLFKKEKESQPLNPVKRLATKDEIKDLFTYLANDHWNSSVIYASSIGAHDVELGYSKFLKQHLVYLKETIGNIVLVEHFEEQDILLYNYFYTSLNIEKRDNMFASQLVLRIANTYQFIKPDESFFNIDYELSQVFNPKANKVGRPSKPSNSSIIKSHKIRQLILDGMNVDEACKKEELAKSTYYRTAKHIVSNSVYTSFPQ